ncbi:Hepatitis A Virus Cellular Receptor 2 [Manis pentadactyla]|nr:Hepatitis A Virus Cellular Receptor 2 [Manis pentadactyla]
MKKKSEHRWRLDTCRMRDEVYFRELLVQPSVVLPRPPHGAGWACSEALAGFPRADFTVVSSSAGELLLCYRSKEYQPLEAGMLHKTEDGRWLHFSRFRDPF